MKRYAKRARPLWGCGARKPRPPIVYLYDTLHVTLEGEDTTGATVRESIEWPKGATTITSETKFVGAPRVVLTRSKVRADLRVKVTFSGDGHQA